MLNTFIIPLQSVVDEHQRVHCSLNLNTETGRLSARQPNLQLELRVLAHMTKCKNMIEAFRLGGDFHSRTGGVVGAW